MKEFLSLVVSNLKNFTQVSLSHTETLKVQNSVMDSLKLENLNHLRDKYEGVAFIENFKLQIYGVIALEKLLNIELIDWSKTNPKRYNPTIKIKNKLYDVIMSEYGELPVIKKTSKRGALLTIKKNDKDIWICGFADTNILNNNQNDKYLKIQMRKDIENLTCFTGFDRLRSFKNLQELISVIENK